MNSGLQNGHSQQPKKKKFTKWREFGCVNELQDSRLINNLTYRTLCRNHDKTNGYLFFGCSFVERIMKGLRDMYKSAIKINRDRT